METHCNCAKKETFFDKAYDNIKPKLLEELAI